MLRFRGTQELDFCLHFAAWIGTSAEAPTSVEDTAMNRERKTKCIFDLQ
jgi:hypothetical protein